MLDGAAGIGTVAAHSVDPAGAVLSIDLNQGNLQPMPIASDGESVHGISLIIAANLRMDVKAKRQALVRLFLPALPSTISPYGAGMIRSTTDEARPAALVQLL